MPIPTRPLACVRGCTPKIIDENNFFYVFYIGHFLRFKVFFIFQTFFIFKKNVGKVQSGKQINKKHFQNNSNEIDLNNRILHPVIRM